MKQILRFKKKLFPDIFPIGSEPENLVDPRRLFYFLIHFLQFIGILTIVHLLMIEKSSGIIEYTYLILITFALYSFTTTNYKHAVLFMAMAFIILKSFGLIPGFLFIFLGIGLVTIAHLNIRHLFKIILIAVLFCIFAIGKTELVYMPKLNTLLSYLMPLFMFRIIIYMYELKHGLVIKSYWQSIVYFFLLPNIFFLFFPIVDYKNYTRTYYNAPEKEMWQKGIRWMLRGIFHMLAYRIICSWFLINSSEVNDLQSLMTYLFSNYFLIVRLSGIFHFTIGFLCMFGMNLPKVFDNYFIATSFVDLWRRINIYWRDFILKIFFYPVMFIYKKHLKKYLLPITMMTVFFVTWILHSYQLFWITGYFSLNEVDIVFWMTVGVCITLNSMMIEKQSSRVKAEPKSLLLHYVLQTVKIIGMLLFMSVMWALWNSKTINEWLFLLSYTSALPNEYLLIFMYGICSLASGVFFHYVFNSQRIKKLINTSPSKTLFLTAPTIVIIIIMCGTNIRRHLPLKLNTILQVLYNNAPNAIDKKNAEIGYYDRLIEGDEDVSIGIGSRAFKKRLKKNPYNIAYYNSTGLLNRRMKPNLNIKGLDHDFLSNQFGIRDKYYHAEKKPGTYRMALLGGSYEMGSGVSNHQNFEYLTEEKLNQHLPDTTYKSIEIWNFSAGGYYLIEHLELLNTEVFKYNPDAVIYFAHSDERNKMIKNLTNVIKRNIPITHPFLNEIIKIAGVKSYMGEKQIKQLLNPYIDCILQWSYNEIAIMCKKHHAKTIWVYLLTTEETVNENEYQTILNFAKQAGYITMDLSDVYGTLPRRQIQISEINAHPNVLGQTLIANKFYKEIVKHNIQIFRNK